MTVITYEHFTSVEILAGTVVKVEVNEKARKPAYKVWVDFGPAGVLQSSAQVTVHYRSEQLVGKQVMGCVNLGDKNIAGFVSQFLLLGFSDASGDIVLVHPTHLVPNGAKMH